VDTDSVTDALDGKHRNKSCWVPELPHSFQHNLLAGMFASQNRVRLLDPFHALPLEKEEASAMDGGVVMGVSNLQSVQKAVIVS
jgi:hypothetical protein